MFQAAAVDWTLAIERNREPLLRIVAALFAMIGLAGGGSVERLSRPVYRAVLRVLRPAEAAVRRLIVVAARDLVVKPRPARPAPAGLAVSGRGRGRLSFLLFDTRRHPGRRARRPIAASAAQPRIRFFNSDIDPRVPLFRPGAAALPAAGPEPDPAVNAAPLCRRLLAIRRALEDLPHQAKRYARWRSRPVEQRRPRLVSALRRGPPPGLRRRPEHDVDRILARCHDLARALPAADTS